MTLKDPLPSFSGMSECSAGKRQNEVFGIVWLPKYYACTLPNSGDARILYLAHITSQNNGFQKTERNSSKQNHKKCGDIPNRLGYITTEAPGLKQPRPFEQLPQTNGKRW